MEDLRERMGLNGSTLKMIAAVTMLIDHIAAVLLVKILIDRGVLEITTYGGERVMLLLTSENSGLLSVYQTMRNIGRLAFPIYCFMLVEGFKRTGNMGKYLGRIFFFAWISEVPFDLAFAARPIYWGYQNVMFTLFLGLLAMYISGLIKQKVPKWFVRWPLTLLIWLTGMQLAELMGADYGAKGVFCIGVLYLFRYAKGLQLLGGALSFIWELPASLSFVFIALYNGRKGKSFKRFFYAFYPVHLAVLYLNALALGLGKIMVI